jgi:hypothetical protein
MKKNQLAVTAAHWLFTHVTGRGMTHITIGHMSRTLLHDFSHEAR